jgi:hypothetical protein
MVNRRIYYIVKIKLILIIIPVLIFNRTMAQEKPVAIVGGTLVDVTGFGNSTLDIQPSVVIIQHGRIIAAGYKHRVKIPPGTTTINAEGKYIVPGLIDCFSVIGTQGQANSHLYYGVTTIVAGPGNYQRAGFFPQANPAPHIKLRGNIPSRTLEQSLEKKSTLSPDDIRQVSLEIDKIDSLKKAGVNTILLQHMFPEELIPKMVAQCSKYGINTIGEIQYAHYSAGLKAGINSFVHTSRYITGAFPDSIFVSTRNQHDSLANVRFGRYLYGFNIDTDPNFNSYAKTIASSRTALMPTLAMLYSSLSDHQNIWKEPGAWLTDPKDVFLPMDTATGKSTSYISTKSANRQIEFEKAFIKAGVHYITGSGADALGTLPGISEHIEIQMLHRYGLTNRQALAAATNNASIFNHWANIGLIEAGRDADLLILSANPVTDLENLKKIDMLLLKGKLIDRKSLLNLKQPSK